MDLLRTTLFVAVLTALGSAHAADYSPTRFDDPAPDACIPADCSLREAVLAANASAGQDTILLASGTYTLSNTGGLTDLYVSDSLRLLGQGVNSTALASAGNGRALNIFQTQLELRGVSVHGFTAVGVPGTGGGALMSNQSDTLIVDSSFLDNRSGATGQVGNGGAISVSGGSLELRNVRVERNASSAYAGALFASSATVRLTQGTNLSDNSATLDGGAITTGALTTIWIDANCRIQNNAAGRDGGAIHGHTYSVRGGEAGSLLQPLALISENVAAGRGGGLNATHELTIERIAVNSNESGLEGGGIYAVGGLRATDVQIALNRALGDGGGVYLGSTGSSQLERVSLDRNQSETRGGALVNPTQPAVLINTDVYGNMAPARAAVDNGGVMVFQHVTAFANGIGLRAHALHQRDTGTTALRNSVLAGTCSGNLPLITSSGGNVQQSFSFSPCPLTAPQDLPAASATTLGLKHADFGGPFAVTGITTATSPAINRGNINYCSRRDVRNATRDTRCDVGSYEYGATAP